MTRFLAVHMVLLLFGRLLATAASEERDLSAQFGGYDGAFALYDEATENWLRYRPDQCCLRTSPCSTFKILNALIALETGVASGADFSLPWDGTRRSIEEWNRDQTLRSAFSASCVWYFQTLATRIGLKRYQEMLPNAGYGNSDVTGGVTRFWLESSLAISPDEQVHFLRRLHARQLIFSDKAVDTVLDIMTLSRHGQTIFRGKTGSGGNATKATLGWFVGSVSTPRGDCFFATRITGGENASGRTAREITEAILSSLRILPSLE